MAITVVQNNRTVQNSGLTSYALTFAATPTSGNKLIAVVFSGGNPSTTWTITDNKSNTWTKRKEQIGASTASYAAIWDCSPSTISATYTVTCAVSDATNDTDFAIIEVSGLGAFDQSAAATNSSTSVTATTPTLSNASELVIYSAAMGNSTVTPASGFTTINNDTGGAAHAGACGYKTVAATTAVGVTVTSTGTGVTALVVGTWQAAASGTIYNDSLSEAGSASETVAGLLVGTNALNESGTAADTLTGLFSTATTLSETGAAADTITGLRVSADNVAETGSASDTNTGAIASTNAVNEAGSAADTVSATLVAVGAVSETGAAADTLTGLLTATGAVTETGAAADTSSGLLVIAASISEAGSAVDTLTGGLAYAVSLAETASASDTPAASVTVVGSVSETGSAADSSSAVQTAVGAVAETGSASDAVASQISTADAVAEAASAADTVGYLANQIYNETVSENCNAADTTDATGGTVPNADTHDPGGYWSKKWAALRAREAAKGRKRKPDPETVEDVLETVFPLPLSEVSPALVAKAKTAIRQGLAVQTEAAFDRKIAQVQALMAQAIEDAERQDEEDLMLVLMEMMD